MVDELIKEYGYQVNKDFILRTYLVLYNDDIKFRVQNFSIKNAKEFFGIKEHYLEKLFEL